MSQQRWAICTISAATALPLRQQLLRPHQVLRDCVLPGDADAETRHFGAFVEGRLVGIASLYRQAPPTRGEPRAWRIRAVATVPEVRGRGCAGALLAACIEHARACGAAVLWCNARISARGFYAHFGFRVCGESFDIAGIGAHLRMERRL